VSDERPTKRISPERIAAARAGALGPGPGEPELADLPRRGRGVVWLDARAAEAMLRLPHGQRVVSIGADWLRDGIAFVVEGPGLPPQEEGMLPEPLPAGNYVDFHLLDKVRALAERWHIDREGRDDDELLGLLIATLTGNYDPRTELPS